MPSFPISVLVINKHTTTSLGMSRSSANHIVPASPLSQFEVILDSRYRDRRNYPRLAEFTVPVNPTPQNNDSNSIYFLNNELLSAFQWKGNLTYTAETLPPFLSDCPVIPDLCSVEGTISGYLASNMILLDAQGSSGVTNFYTGLLFYVPYSGETSLVAGYDAAMNVLQLNTALATSTLAHINSSRNVKYQIINTSVMYINTVCPLGVNKFYLVTSTSGSIQGAYLQQGPASQVYLQNVTRNWISPIETYLGEYRTLAIAKPLVAESSLTPSPYPVNYASTDIFQLRYTEYCISAQASDNSTIGSMKSFVITAHGSGYQKGQTVQASFHEGVILVDLVVVSIDPVTGSLIQLRPVTIGQNLQVGDTAEVIGGGDDVSSTNATIRVTEVGMAVPIQLSQTSSLLSSLEPDACIVFYPHFDPTTNLIIYERSYFLYLGHYQNYVFFSSFLLVDEPGLFQKGDWIEFQPLQQQTVGLDIPFSPVYRFPVCYEVRLVSLILPNQLVVGYQTLPSFFPFFYLELYNVSGSMNNQQVVYTNIPNSSKLTFYCPNGNPLNPEISQFVIVRSWQRNIMKWNPVEDIYCRIALPDGSTLQYEFETPSVVINAKETDTDRLLGFQNSITQFTKFNITINLQFTLVMNG